jgi:tetratricopeptide (TPR) repeat protein
MRLSSAVLVYWTLSSLPLVAQQQVPSRREAAVLVATERLARARQLAAAVPGTEGETRAIVVEVAANAYEEVVALQGDGVGPLAARAAMEAARLRHARGQFDRAERLWRAAAVRDPGVARRALSCVADLQRRRGQPEEAMAAYRRVLALGGDATEVRRARIWLGRLQQQQGEWEAALTSFSQAYLQAVSATELLETANLLVNILVERGDLSAARRRLDELEVRLGRLSQGRLERDRWLHRSCNLSCRRALQRRLDEQAGAARHALDLDRALRRQRLQLPRN